MRAKARGEGRALRLPWRKRPPHKHKPVMATDKRRKRVSLTCKCGTSYTLNTIHDLRARCINESCGASLNISADELWKYQESLIALLEAIGLGRNYKKELDTARRVSEKLTSPYTIEVVEIP